MENNNKKTETKADKKVYLRETLIYIIEKEKSNGRKIVFTNGCFDILHIGHAKYLAAAKEFGDILIVAVNSDSSVKKLKGESRPINKADDRMLLLAHLESVDYVIEFNEITAIKTILMFKPHFYVKGGDVKLDTVPEKNTVESYGGKIVMANHCIGYSSTNIINKINKN